MITFAPLSTIEPAAYDALLDRAFGADRLARTAARVRAGARRVDAACLAALDESRLVGSVAVHQLLWCGGGNGERRPLAWLGPLARDPDRHGEGIGVALMQHALAVLDSRGANVALIGDAPYYARWGFRADATAGWQMPGPVDPARLLLRAADHSRFSGPATLAAEVAASAPA